MDFRELNTSCSQLTFIVKKFKHFERRPAAVKLVTVCATCQKTPAWCFHFMEMSRTIHRPMTSAIINALFSHRNDCAWRGGHSCSVESWCQWDDSHLSAFGTLRRRPSSASFGINPIEKTEFGGRHLHVDFAGRKANYNLLHQIHHHVNDLQNWKKCSSFPTGIYCNKQAESNQENKSRHTWESKPQNLPDQEWGRPLSHWPIAAPCSVSFPWAVSLCCLRARSRCGSLFLSALI